MIQTDEIDLTASLMVQLAQNVAVKKGLSGGVLGL